MPSPPSPNELPLAPLTRDELDAVLFRERDALNSAEGKSGPHDNNARAWTLYRRLAEAHATFEALMREARGFKTGPLHPIQYLRAFFNVTDVAAEVGRQEAEEREMERRLWKQEKERLSADLRREEAEEQERGQRSHEA
jgi:hypothetical protein